MTWPGARSLVMAAGLAGFTVVVLAALGAHLDGGIDDPSALRSWQSAVLMHGLHAVALLALAALEYAQPSAWWRAAGLSLMLGILLFSGSLYLGVILEMRSPLAPMGGLALMLGWLLAALGGWRTRPVAP